MNKNQIHSTSYLKKPTQLASTTTLLALAMFAQLALSNPVGAHEQNWQAFQEESFIGFQKQADATRFSYSPSREGKPMCEITKKFKITTFLSKPEGHLKSQELINKFFSSNELSVMRNIQKGAMDGALFEVRF